MCSIAVKTDETFHNGKGWQVVVDLGTRMSWANTAEPIEMSFWRPTHMGARNDAFDDNKIGRIY